MVKVPGFLLCSDKTSMSALRPERSAEFTPKSKEEGLKSVSPVLVPKAASPRENAAAGGAPINGSLKNIPNKEGGEA